MDDKKGLLFLGGGLLLAAALFAGKAKAEPIPPTPYLCPFGDGEFNTLAELEAHMNAVHPTNPNDPEPPPTQFICPFNDGQSFETLAELQAHVLAAHQPPPPPPAPGELEWRVIGGQNVLTNFEYNAWRAYFNPELLQTLGPLCPICGEFATGGYPLEQHISWHSASGWVIEWSMPAVCPFDQTRFANITELTSHLKTEHHYNVNLPGGSGGGFDPGYGFDGEEPEPEPVSGWVKIKVWNHWDNQVGPFNVQVANLANKDAEIRAWIATHLAEYIANTPEGESWTYWEV